MLAVLYRKLAWQWWRLVLLVLVLFFVAGRFELAVVLQQEPWGMLYFALGLLTLFFSRTHFHAFKRAVIALGKDPQRFEAVEHWNDYLRVRGKALWVAGLPAFTAVPGLLIGLEPVAGFLLLLCSLLLFWLYRTPGQLWYRAGSVKGGA